MKVAREDGHSLNLILEVKGFESEKDRAKQPAAHRWVDAVNYQGGYSVWRYHEAKGRSMADALIEKYHKAD